MNDALNRGAAWLGSTEHRGGVVMKLEQVMIVRPKIEPKPVDPESECQHCDDPDTCGNTGRYLTDFGLYRVHERLETGYFAQFVPQLSKQERALMMKGYRPNQVLVPLCAPGTLHFTFRGSEIIRSGEVRTPTLQRSETYNHE